MKSEEKSYGSWKDKIIHYDCKKVITKTDYDAWLAGQKARTIPASFDKTAPAPEEGLRRYLGGYVRANYYLNTHPDDDGAYAREMRMTMMDIKQIINTLTEYDAEAWEIMRLHYVDGEYISDIAESMHYCEASIYSKMKNARLWLINNLNRNFY